MSLTRSTSLRQGQLLRQQFIKLDAAPGRMAVFEQIVVAELGRWVMQKPDSLVKRHQAIFATNFFRQGVAQVRIIERIGNGFAQLYLAQAICRGVNRGQGAGQGLAGFGDFGVHHFQAMKALAHFAAYSQGQIPLQLLELAGVKVQPAQGQLATFVGNTGMELRTGTSLNIRTKNTPFNLRHLARVEMGDGLDLSLVLVAQRKMDHEVGRLS